MANTFFGLTIAKSGLDAANIAINTTAHNISNINTEGYTKQVTVQQANGAIRVYSSYGAVSTGVSVESIKQLRSSYYDAKYMEANTNQGQYASYENYSTLLEDYLDEFNLNGFTKEYANLCNAIDDLALDPGVVTTRTLFVDYCTSICDYFNTLSTNFANVQKQANDEIRSVVDKINNIAERVASLNKQINTIEINGGFANDLRDARSLLLDELSGYVNTEYDERDIGNNLTEMKVYINGQEIVEGYDYHTLKCDPRPQGELRNASDIEGLYDIHWDTGLTFNMYNPSLSGQLRAAIDVCNGNNEAYEVRTLRQPITYAMDSDGNRVDGSLEELLDQGYKAEQIHTEYDFLYQTKAADGTTVYGTKENLLAAGYEESKILYAKVQDMDIATYQAYQDAGYETTLASYESPLFNSNYKGVPFYQAAINSFVQSFADSFNNIIAKGDLGKDASGKRILPDKLFTAKYDSDYISAANMQVNPQIIADLKKLPISFDNSVGAANTDMAMALKSIRETPVLNNGTYSDYLSSIVSVIAVDTNSAKEFCKTYDTIKETIDHQRMSVSGVDEDEEAVDLVRFQKAYSLASKVISVMQEIYSKLIEQTGV